MPIDATLRSRLLLEGKNTKADIVLGLDTNLTAEAAATGLFAPHGMDLSALKLPMAWSDPVFVPYDYGYFAFVYDSQKITAPPKSFEELLNGPADWQILIQDPRSSTPGLGLLMDPTNYFEEHNIDRMEAVLKLIFDTLADRVRISHAKDVKRAEADTSEKHADIGD